MPAGAKLFLSLGSLLALAAVALGAFGANGLKARLTPDLLAIWQTAAQYHFYHSLGLLLVGFAFFHLPDGALLRASGWLMVVGIALFSGSLYVLAITGEKWLGAVAPVGGTAFLLAWGAFAWAVFRAP